MVDRGRFFRIQDAEYLDQRIASQAPVGKRTYLHPLFVPNHWTVICARGKRYYDHSK